MVALTLLSIGPAAHAKKRVAVVKIKIPHGSKETLQKAARLCRMYIEENFRLVDEADFHDAADALKIERAVWKPENLVRIARRARLDAVVAVFAAQGALQVGVVDAANGKMLTRTKVPFSGKFTHETVAAVRQAIKVGMDKVVGSRGAPIERRRAGGPGPGPKPEPPEPAGDVMGLSVGVTAGFTSGLGFYDGNVGVGGGITAELDLGRVAELSGLHLMFGVWFGADARPGAMFDTIYDVFPYWRGGLTDATPFAFHYDLGLIKRFGVSKNLSFELGFALSGSVHQGGEDDMGDLKARAAGIGGTLLVGIAAQLSPRWFLRLDTGYRLLATFGIVSNELICTSKDPRCGSSLVGPEHGLIGQIGLFHTY